jgi:2-polyprenyl-6-methoxyphenol hydroxylase-like FAD-dependent oxidoreductase
MTDGGGDQTAIIVGAGIGGLTLAAGLQHAGVQVTVLEQAGELVPVGAGLTLQPNAIIALRRMRLDGPVIEAGTVLHSATIYDADGTPLLALSQRRSEQLLAAVGAPAVGIHRATLQRVLLDAVAPETVRLGVTVSGLSDDGHTVVTAHGEQLTADIVIGADGIDSTIRTALRGREPVRYSGYYCWRGVGPLGGFGPHWAGEFWGQGRRFGGCAIDGDRLYWFATANGPPDGSDHYGARLAALDVVADFAPDVITAVARTPALAVFRTDIADREPITTWGFGPMTLLGDAAHPMTPNLGQGACQAIEDAAELSAWVASMGACPAALRQYERRRVPRANATVLAARRAGELGQVSGGVAVATRRKAARLLPSALVARQLRRSWQVPR